MGPFFLQIIFFRMQTGIHNFGFSIFGKFSLSVIDAEVYEWKRFKRFPRNCQADAVANIGVLF